MKREVGGAGAGASAARTTPAVTAVSQKINFKPTLNVEPELDAVPVTWAPKRSIKIRPVAAGLESALALEKSAAPAKGVTLAGAVTPPKVTTEVGLPAGGR